MSMREKIALAVANADDNSHVVLGRGAFTNAEWKGFEKIADAVLDALMEPTEEMMENEDDLSLSVWKDMIRAAQEGK